MPKFKKISGGTYRHYDGTKYKMGDIVECASHEIPEGFMDSFELIKGSDVGEKEVERTLRTPKVKFAVVKRGGDMDGYDVVNEKTLKAINDKPLTIEEAKSLVADVAGD